MATYAMETSLLWKPVQTTIKKSSKFIKKITHIDDMMIHNIVKYFVQSCPDDLLEIYYFCISQTKSSLDMIFYKVVYHHIIYMCDFFREFRWLFCRGLHRFSRRLRFSLDMFPINLHKNICMDWVNFGKTLCYFVTINILHAYASWLF